MLNFRTLLLTALVALPGEMVVQAGELRKGTSEVTGFAGIADGQGTFGGAFGRAVTNRVFVYGDAGYIAGESASVAGFSASSHAMNFHGGLQYSFRTESRLVPYAAAGIGITRVSASVSGIGLPVKGSNSSVMFAFGGGARYYIGRNWGIRPELMVFAGDGSYIRAGAGVFFQF